MCETVVRSGAKSILCRAFIRQISSKCFVSAVRARSRPAKAEANGRWPLLPLYTRAEVSKFLVLTLHSRSFILGIYRTTATLTDVLHKRKELVRGETRGPIRYVTFSSERALFDFDKRFFLTTEASEAAVGVMLP